MAHSPGVQLLTTPSPSGTGRSPASDGAAGANQFRSDFAAQLQGGAQGAVSRDAGTAHGRPAGATVTHPPAPNQVVPATLDSPGEGVKVSQVRSVATLTTEFHHPVSVQLVNGLLNEGQISTGGTSLPRPGNSLPPFTDAHGNTLLIGDLLSEPSSDGPDGTEATPLAAPFQALPDQPEPAQQIVISLSGDRAVLANADADADAEPNPASVVAPTEADNLAQSVITPGLERVVPALFKGAFDNSPHAGKIREHLQTVPGGKLTSVPLPDAVPSGLLKSAAPGALVTDGEALAEAPVAIADTKFDLGAKVSGELGLTATAGNAGNTTVTNLLASLTSAAAPPAAAGAFTPFALQLGDAVPGNIPTLALHTPAGTPGWTGELGNQIRWLLERNGQVAELRLNPAELGSVDVRLSKDGDNTNVMFYTTNSHARELLEAALPRLRDMFAAQGVNLGEANVSEQSLAQHHESQHAQNQGGDTSRRNGIHANADIIRDESMIASTVTLTQGLIDYYV